MARPKKKTAPRGTSVPADPLLLQVDLEAWAGPQVAKGGRADALLGRVESLRLGADGRTLEARVRDTGPAPHRIRVTISGDHLAATCTCAYADGPCKHAVASVLALRFPRPDPVKAAAVTGRRSGRQARGKGRIVTPAPVQAGTLLAGPGHWAPTREERVVLARQEEIQQRKRRASRERAPVSRLPMRGGPPRFQVPGREPEAPYLVVLRGAALELPSCSCPDFVKSELGTCKHVERVRRWFARRAKRLTDHYLSIWWRPREWPEEVPDPLREIRLDLPGQPVPESLARWFEPEGWLRPPPDGAAPSAWLRGAIEAGRSEADAKGRSWDLDPAVESGLARLEETENLDAKLRGLAVGDALWTEIVPGLGFKLHPYQEEGAIFLARRGRAFLADDMGLGKTLQAVVAALLLRRAAGTARALVVCPASLKHQWRNEIHKACGEDALVVEGSREDRAAAYRRWREGFLILNYELVLRDLDLITRAEADLVILDEAQRIKNWDTKTAKAVKKLNSKFAFILTGTPLENRLTELHSLVEFLHPRALGPRWRLLPFHAVTDPTGRVQAYEALGVLRSRMEGFFLRRERDEVLDQLPPRTDNTFWTEMTPVQWRPYRRHASTVARLLAGNRPLKAAEIRVLLQALTSMRVLCNAYAQYAWDRYGPRLEEGGPIGRSDQRAVFSPKFEEFARVIEDLLEESASKVVVFSQWERALRIGRFVVGDLLERRGERAEIFHGGLDARSRTRMLEAFRTEREFRVLFATDAGGLGLNLQEAASIVVHLEVPWNPAVLEQRIGRVHRMGQRQSVRVLHFVTRGAIEERVRQVVESKKALFEGLLVDEADRVVFDDAGQASFVEQVRTLLDPEP